MLRRTRLLIGDMGLWVLGLLAVLIHGATVVIAFQWYEGAGGWIAAATSAVIPALPEVYWAYSVASREGTLAHWYVLSVIGYAVLCGLFVAGAAIFMPVRSAD